MQLPFVGQGLAAKLAELRRQLDLQTKSLANSRAILATVEADRDEIATREHRGEISAEKSSEEFAGVEDRERLHLSEVDRLTRMCALLAGEIEQVESEAALAEYAQAVDEVKRTQQAQFVASAWFAKSLAGTASAGAKLERARAAAAAAVERARELHVDGAAELPIVDEAEWLDRPKLEELLELAEEGPRQPLAAGAARSAAAHRLAERQDRELVDQVVRGLPALATAEAVEAEFMRLPERLQPIARERACKANADARRISEERDARERAHAPQRVTL